jgi:hypothetical protein
MAQADTPANRWKNVGLLGVFFLVASVLIYLVAVWIIRKPLPPLALSGIFVLYGMSSFMILRAPPVAATPSPVEGKVKDALAEVGLANWRVFYREMGPAAEFPRPVCLGKCVSVSRRLVDELSPAAFAWFIRAEALGSHKSTVKGAILVLVLQLSALAVLGLVASRSVSLPIALGIIATSFVALWGIIRYYQFKADQIVTQTEEDRHAASEALSLPYFAQQDKRGFQKWMFTRRELKTRADRLGVELVRPNPSSNLTLTEPEKTV